MAYDKRRLNTFKWLQRVADRDRFDIMVYSGRIYVTDEVLLARVDYPEFYRLSDWEWCRVKRFQDENGLLLETPEIELLYRQFTDNLIFENMFLHSVHRFEGAIDPLYMKLALKPFEINRINPMIETSYQKVELSGHNKDVSIRVVFMGMGVKK